MKSWIKTILLLGVVGTITTVWWSNKIKRAIAGDDE